MVPQSLTRKQYLLEVEEHVHAVESAKHDIVVIGGGAVGIEMASELKFVNPGLNVTLAHSRDELLSSEALPDETKARTLECLQAEGVEVLMGHRLSKAEKRLVEGATTYDVEFTNGHSMVASQVIMAISKSTSTLDYLPKAAVNDDGFAKIRPT